jgi:tripartite-type tricarboxylate transporter receptor subunit TctC
MFATPVTSIEYIKTGRLRALGVTTRVRSEVLPEVPSISELVPGYEASAFFGVGAPAGTPTEIIERLNQEINAALRHPPIRKRLADLGGSPLEGSARQFGELIADETMKWQRVINSAGIRPE